MIFIYTWCFLHTSQQTLPYLAFISFYKIRILFIVVIQKIINFFIIIKTKRLTKPFSFLFPAHNFRIEINITVKIHTWRDFFFLLKTFKLTRACKCFFRIFIFLSLDFISVSCMKNYIHKNAFAFQNRWHKSISPEVTFHLKLSWGFQKFLLKILYLFITIENSLDCIAWNMPRPSWK